MLQSYSHPYQHCVKDISSVKLRDHHDKKARDNASTFTRFTITNRYKLRLT